MDIKSDFYLSFRSRYASTVMVIHPNDFTSVGKNQPTSHINDQDLLKVRLAMHDWTHQWICMMKWMMS